MTSLGDREEKPEPTPVTILAVLLRRLRWFLTPPIVAVIVALAAYILHYRHQYIATAVIVPSASTSSGGGLSSLVAQFGLSVNLPGQGEPLAFYEELVRSRELMLALAQTGYVGPGSADSTEIIDLLGVELAGDTNQYFLNAVDVLRSHVSTAANLNAGTITIRTTADDQRLAEFLGHRILELVNDFNLRKRRHQPAEEMRFTQERLAAAHAELQQAERAVEEFLERNRSYERSPALQFEYSRLQRRLDLRQSVYVALAQAHEQASIEAVRNTPVITVLDHPAGSAEKAKSLFGLLFLAGALGTVGGVGLAFVREYLDNHPLTRAMPNRRRPNSSSPD